MHCHCRPRLLRWRRRRRVAFRSAAQSRASVRRAIVICSITTIRRCRCRLAARTRQLLCLPPPLNLALISATIPRPLRLSSQLLTRAVSLITGFRRAHQESRAHRRRLECRWSPVLCDCRFCPTHRSRHCRRSRPRHRLHCQPSIWFLLSLACRAFHRCYRRRH